MYRCTSLFIILIAIVLAFSANAQVAADTTLQLDAAMVEAKRHIGTSEMDRFSIGTAAIVSDSASIARQNYSSLNRYISYYSPAYVFESGSGATISLRGTDASHTSVTWNGVNITPATMGVLNLRQVPLFLLDEVAVHAGGESALYGGGSIGGNLQLKSDPSWGESQSLMLQQNAGSFGYTFSGLKLAFGGKSWQSKTAALYNQAKNDFTFVNTANHNVIDTQTNAAYRNGGIQQDFYFKLLPNTTLSSQTRFMAFFNEIQPTMAELSIADSIRDKYLHSIITLNHSANVARLTFTGGYLYDYEKFKKDVIATHRITGIVEAEKLMFKILRVKLGVSTDYIIPKVHAFRDGIHEWRNDVYALFLCNIGSRTELSANFRQLFVTDLKVPFTPSLGLSHKLINGLHQQLKLRANVARNVKLPSLNDRYWGQQGNANAASLRPEYGTTVEGGLDYRLVQRTFLLDSRLTAYHSIINDWIEWIPRGHIWRPINFEEVKTSGIEAQLSSELNFYQVKLRLGGTYALTNSIVEKGIDEGDPRVGKQRAFQPKHRAAGMADVSYKGWVLGVNLSYVGQRYGTDQNMLLPDYLLTSLTAEKQLLFGKHQFTISAQVNNLMDVSYQPTSYFAMPGRSWNVGIQYHFQ